MLPAGGLAVGATMKAFRLPKQGEQLSSLQRSKWQRVKSVKGLAENQRDPWPYLHSDGNRKCVEVMMKLRYFGVFLQVPQHHLLC